MRKRLLELMVSCVIGIFVVNGTAIAQSDTRPPETVKENSSTIETKSENKKPVHRPYEEVRELLSKVRKHLEEKKKGAPMLAAADEADAGDLTKSFNITLDYCQGVLGKYETKSTWLQITKVGLAVVGAVSGIAVPVLTAAAASGNAGWIAGLGGVSGVTNAAQAAMSESGLTTAATLQTRQQILSEFNTAIKDYLDPKNDAEVRMMSIQKAMTACVLHSIIIQDQQSGTPKSDGN